MHGVDIDALEAKLSVDPGDEQTFPALAEAYRQDQRPDEARRVAEAGVLARPDCALGRIALALALIDQGDVAAAYHTLEVGLAQPQPPEGVAAFAGRNGGALGDDEVEAAFELAEPIEDEMRSVNDVAEAALIADALENRGDLSFTGVIVSGNFDPEEAAEELAAGAGWEIAEPAESIPAAEPFVDAAHVPELEVAEATAEGDATAIVNSQLTATLEGWLENIRRMRA